MNKELMFSSNTDLWATPQDTFDKLNEEFSFEIDVCANADNAKCAKFFTKEDDGLSQDWSGVCWMNPPYGRDYKMDGEGLQIFIIGDNGCLPSSRANRYQVVA